MLGIDDDAVVAAHILGLLEEDGRRERALREGGESVVHAKELGGKLSGHIA